MGENMGIGSRGLRGGSFLAAGLALPFLLGPLAACLLAALMGLHMQDVGRLGIGMRAMLGVAVGASITLELLGRLPAMALSLALPAATRSWRSDIVSGGNAGRLGGSCKAAFYKRQPSAMSHPYRCCGRLSKGRGKIVTLQHFVRSIHQKSGSPLQPILLGSVGQPHFAKSYIKLTWVDKSDSTRLLATSRCAQQMKFSTEMKYYFTSILRAGPFHWNGCQIAHVIPMPALPNPNAEQRRKNACETPHGE